MLTGSAGQADAASAQALRVATVGGDRIAGHARAPADAAARRVGRIARSARATAVGAIRRAVAARSARTRLTRVASLAWLARRSADGSTARAGRNAQVVCAAAVRTRGVRALALAIVAELPRPAGVARAAAALTLNASIRTVGWRARRAGAAAAVPARAVVCARRVTRCANGIISAIRDRVGGNASDPRTAADAGSTAGLGAGARQQEINLDLVVFFHPYRRLVLADDATLEEAFGADCDVFTRERIGNEDAQRLPAAQHHPGVVRGPDHRLEQRVVRFRREAKLRHLELRGAEGHVDVESGPRGARSILAAADEPRAEQSRGQDEAVQRESPRVRSAHRALTLPIVVSRACAGMAR